MERGENGGVDDPLGPVDRRVYVGDIDMRQVEEEAGAVAPAINMRMLDNHLDYIVNGLQPPIIVNDAMDGLIEANYRWLINEQAAYMQAIDDVDWDLDVNHQVEQQLRMELARLYNLIEQYQPLINMRARQVIRVQEPPELVNPVVPDIDAVIIEQMELVPNVPDNDPEEEELLALLDNIPEVPQHLPEELNVEDPPVEEPMVPELERIEPQLPAPEPAIIDEPVVQPVAVENPGGDPEPPAAPEPALDAIAQREADRLRANALHTPHRFKYAGVKRHAGHFNAEPDNPNYINNPCVEETKHNFLWFFTKRRRPRFAEFADTDLISFLRFHTFCVPRTPALIQSLKQRAVRFMADFDMSDYSMAEIYRITACSIAAALVVTPEEELIRETIRTHSNVIERFQPFFQSGQYRAGFLGYGVRSLT